MRESSRIERQNETEVLKGRESVGEQNSFRYPDKQTDL